MLCSKAVQATSSRYIEHKGFEQFMCEEHYRRNIDDDAMGRLQSHNYHTVRSTCTELGWSYTMLRLFLFNKTTIAPGCRECCAKLGTLARSAPTDHRGLSKPR